MEAGSSDQTLTRAMSSAAATIEVQRPWRSTGSVSAAPAQLDQRAREALLLRHGPRSLTLGPQPLGEVAKHGDEEDLAPILHAADQQLDLDLAAIRVERRQLGRLPEDSGLAGGHVASHSRRVRGSHPLGDDPLERLAEDGARRVAEQRVRGLIPVGDSPRRVGADHGVSGQAEQARHAKTRGLSLRRRDPLLRGDVLHQPAEAVVFARASRVRSDPNPSRLGPAVAQPHAVLEGLTTRRRDPERDDEPLAIVGVKSVDEHARLLHERRRIEPEDRIGALADVDERELTACREAALEDDLGDRRRQLREPRLARADRGVVRACACGAPKSLHHGLERAHHLGGQRRTAPLKHQLSEARQAEAVQLDPVRPEVEAMSGLTRRAMLAKLVGLQPRHRSRGITR